MQSKGKETIFENHMGLSLKRTIYIPEQKTVRILPIAIIRPYTFVQQFTRHTESWSLIRASAHESHML